MPVLVQLALEVMHLQAISDYINHDAEGLVIFGESSINQLKEGHGQSGTILPQLCLPLLRSLYLSEIHSEEQRYAKVLLRYLKLLAQNYSGGNVRKHEIVRDALKSYVSQGQKFLLLLLRGGLEDIIHDLQGVTSEVEVYLIHVLVVVEDLSEEGEELLVNWCPRNDRQGFDHDLLHQLHAL